MRADVNLSVREVGAAEVWHPYRDEEPELVQGDRTCHRRRAGASDRAARDGQERSCRRPDAGMTTKNLLMQCVPKRMHRITVTSRNRIWHRSLSADEWIKQIRRRQPELRPQKLERYNKEFDIPEYDAQIITGTKHMADLFEETTKICDKPKKVSNWLMGETMRLLKENSMEAEEICFAPEHLAALIELVDAGTINGSVAKEVFEEMFAVRH